MKAPYAGAPKRKGRPKAIKPNPGASAFSSASSERDAAIERIIKAVGCEPDNRGLLAKDIDAADIDFEKMFFWKKASAGTTRKSIQSIREALEDAAKRIGTDPILKKFFDTSELRRLLKGLRYFEEWQRARRREKSKRRQEKDRQPAPFDWLAREFGHVYESRFGSPATWSWRGDKPQGAVINFIEQVLKELGSPCDQSTIGRAFSNHRAKKEKSSANLPND